MPDPDGDDPVYLHSADLTQLQCEGTATLRPYPQDLTAEGVFLGLVAFTAVLALLAGGLIVGILGSI